MNEYLEHAGYKTGGIGEIKENPDKSKNLKTATFPVFGVSIDVNNLRTETYSEDSRTPEMVRGSPHTQCLPNRYLIFFFTSQHSGGNGPYYFPFSPDHSCSTTPHLNSSPVPPFFQLVKTTKRAQRTPGIFPLVPVNKRVG